MARKLLCLFFMLFSLNSAYASDDDGWNFENSPLYEDELDNAYDPLEPFNRLMFRVNDVLDKVFLVPVSMAYKHVLPKFLQTGIENFASNFFTPVTVINYLLQGNGEYVVKTTFRFLVNTVFGFFGTVDVASKMGLNKKETSLGDTFKKWGAKPGPYLVLPLFGAGSFRSGMGKIMQLPVEPAAQISLLNYEKNTRNKIYYLVYGANVVVKRSYLLNIMMELEKTSDDMYITTRNIVMSAEK